MNGCDPLSVDGVMIQIVVGIIDLNLDGRAYPDESFLDSLDLLFDAA